MTANLPGEVTELERQISDLKKGLIAIKEKVQSLNRAIGETKGDLEAIQVSLNIARSNLKHMRGAADHVVLDEFQAVKKLEKDLADNLSDLRIKLGQAESIRSNMLQNESLIKQAIEQRADKLKEFGKVAPLVRKKKRKSQ